MDAAAGPMISSPTAMPSTSSISRGAAARDFSATSTAARASRRSDNVEQRFTAPRMKQLWPQAELHTQWPGPGTAGDATFDTFYASQVETIGDEGADRADQPRGRRQAARPHRSSGSADPFASRCDRLERRRRAASSGEGHPGDRAQRSADPRDDRERRSGLFRGWRDRQALGRHARKDRIRPAGETASDLKLTRQELADGPGLVRCFLQAEPARQIPRLRGIPILILVSESSYHAPYDHCTARFLDQAGVKNTFVRLTDHGIRGNGHMMMLEKNNLEIAAFLRGWEQDEHSLTTQRHEPAARSRHNLLLQPHPIGSP